MIMGLVALGIGQITAQTESPDVGFATVVINVQTYGNGGRAIFECGAGQLPWNNQCRRQGVIGLKNECGYFHKTFSTSMSVRCDGQQHTGPTKTYWIQKGNQFYNIATVTPTYTLPANCLGGTITSNNVAYGNVPDCGPLGGCVEPNWFCPCQDNGHGYTPSPTCCLSTDTRCATCWDPIGELQYCCCCHENPPFGWVCH
jgi:hypothetical protein